MSDLVDTIKNKYFCIFGGGSIRGMAYVGAFKALMDLGIEITGYVGSSVGSVAAVLAALDYNLDEITQEFMQLDYTLFKDINFSFKIELAISKGEIFTDKIRELITKKLPQKNPITFKDFPKDIYIVTSNLTKGKSVIFSKETTPDFEVAQAVRISAGFPGLMNPYELDGDLFIDGDLLKAYAISQLSPLLNPKDTRILEYRLEGSKYQPPTKNPIVFINNAFDFLSLAATENIIKQYEENDKYDFIVINTEDTLLFDFNISKEKREEIINLGYDTTMKYFKTHLPVKKAKLLNEYSKMKKALDEAFFEFKKQQKNRSAKTLLIYISQNYKQFKNFESKYEDMLTDLTSTLNATPTKFLCFNLNNNIKLITKKFEICLKNLNEKIYELQNCKF